MGTKPHYHYANTYQDNSDAWDSCNSEPCPSTTHAQTSEDTGLWHFGVVETPEGIILVLDITDDYNACIHRTKAIAGSLYSSYILSTDSRDDLEILVQHINRLLGKSLNTNDESKTFFKIIKTYYAFVHITKLTESAITATAASFPEQGKYPANISEPARLIWDGILASDLYNTKTQHTTTLQKWSIVTRMFLDKCNRKGITPFAQPKSVSKNLEGLTKKYAQQRNLAAQLERQVFFNLEAEGLVENLDRGVWKFLKTEYIDKRYVIVIETRWFSLTKNPALLAKHIVDEEHFIKSPVGGWEHNISPTCKLRIRIKRYPDISFRMVLSFSKDILISLGITGRNTDEYLEAFDDIARDWARTRKFHKVRV